MPYLNQTVKQTARTATFFLFRKTQKKNNKRKLETKAKFLYNRKEIQQNILLSLIIFHFTFAFAAKSLANLLATEDERLQKKEIILCDRIEREKNVRNEF